jgi:hypothetical protein
MVLVQGVPLLSPFWLFKGMLFHPCVLAWSVGSWVVCATFVF